jgi:hypothetical protein
MGCRLHVAGFVLRVAGYVLRSRQKSSGQASAQHDRLREYIRLAAPIFLVRLQGNTSRLADNTDTVSVIVQ